MDNYIHELETLIRGIAKEVYEDERKKSFDQLIEHLKNAKPGKLNI